MKNVTATAHPNIALVKYWGKRDTALNLPAVGSLSITLDTLETTTRVEFDDTLDVDRLELDGVTGGAGESRVSACLDLLRDIAGADTRARVVSSNNFPTGAGLASSASGFAALVVAADAALDLGLPPARLSELARRGSGSAARSIFGGFVEMHHGRRTDGADCIAEPLLPASEWPLAVTVGIVSKAAKAVGSTDGMELTRETSPYYSAWVDNAETDLQAARSALDTRDFEKLADVSEHSCLKMHALAMSANPGLMYWQAPTVAGINRVRALRRAGHAVFFTIDAGPQLKVVSLPGELPAVRDALTTIDGLQEIVHTGLGEGARVVAGS